MTFESGELASLKNSEVALTVKKNNGEKIEVCGGWTWVCTVSVCLKEVARSLPQLQKTYSLFCQNCIYLGCGEPAHSTFHCHVLHHTGSPVWRETVRINLEPVIKSGADVDNCHLFFAIKQASSGSSTLLLLLCKLTCSFFFLVCGTGTLEFLFDSRRLHHRQGGGECIHDTHARGRSNGQGGGFL